MYETVLSSKGQVVLPVELMEKRKIIPGSRFAVKETPYGFLLVPIPKDPIKALRGIAKGMGITYEEIKEMRRRDDKHDRAENFI